ncbi:MAG: metallophosphoesterase, partial [Bacteroidetes bacterium]|nr:metallophosphoesterase [Bacteroidota bacterium]
PFFTDVPVESREKVPGVGTRMTDHIKTKLLKIPEPRGNAVMELKDIVGTQGVTEILAEKAIIFHATGDTGHENGADQEFVAEAMAKDYDVKHPAKSPAFFLLLGDANYYDNTDRGYHAQFYVPYKKYPGKIIAIPGNHDGELFRFDNKPTGQKTTLEAFLKNFCQPKPGVPSAAGSIFREMVSQPGVYWQLDAPLVDIIGLYSNVAENPGYIKAPSIGDHQYTWLIKTLKAIAAKRKAGKRKALIFAVHHPPLSQGGHSGSTEMLADMDEACRLAGIMPDVVFAAHAHSYQRFTRTVSFNGKSMEIPYLVVGSGGRGIQPVPAATGQVTGDHRFEKSLKGFGYSRVTITERQVSIEFFQVDKEQIKSFDKVKVD